MLGARWLRDFGAGRVEDARRVGDRLLRPLHIVSRLDGLLDRIDRAVDRVNETEAHAAAVVVGIDDLQRRAERLVDDNEPSVLAVGRTLQAWLPVLDKLRSALEPIVNSWQSADSRSVLVAVRNSSRLSDEFEREALPVLASLRSISPDLEQLVALSRGLNELIGTLPGLGKVKRRVDAQLPDAGPASSSVSDERAD